MAAEAEAAVQVCFPEATRALLEALNRQREAGQLCDLAIRVQGRVFRAHRAVLAACSPYFHDQVLLKDLRAVELPAVLDPAAFERVLGSAYTGRLRMARDDLLSFLTVGSVLQMWHIVDKCTELLKERQRRSRRAPDGSQSPSSSSFGGGPEQPRARDRQEEEAEEEAAPRRPAPPPEPSARRGAPAPDGGGEPRTAPVRPSTVPQRRWAPVKEERGGRAEREGPSEEEEEEEDDDDDEPAALSITDVRTLSAAPPPEEQVNFCESSQDVAFPPPPPAQPRALLPAEPPPPPPPPLLFPAGAPSGVPPSSAHGAVQLPGPPGEAHKIFLCHCGKAFSHKSMRDRHVNMHLNLRPFACPVCSKRFKMKHHLTEHMKTHTGLKPYQCPVCAKRFMWRDSFVRHRGHCERRHHHHHHRPGPAGTLGGPRKEASPPRRPGEAEGAAGRSPRSDGPLAGTGGKM